MAKKPAKKATAEPGEKPAGVYFRPDPRTEAALRKFIARQPIRPTAPMVALGALQQFLVQQGDLEPEPPK